MRLTVIVVALAACAGRYKTELVGERPIFATSGGEIALPAGAYDLALRFDLPRAQLIEWNVTCPGTSIDGSLGEPFEAYRTRRIAQLRAERDQQRRDVAAITGAVLGSVGARVQTRDATVDAHVSGQAAGDAVAAAAVPDEVIELPPGDVGAGRVAITVHVRTTEAGTCRVSAKVDDPQVAGAVVATRIHDLEAEAHARSLAAAETARAIRVQVSTQLVALGADPQARARRLAIEAEARERAAAAQAEIRLRAEAEVRARREAKIQIEVRVREAALQARGVLIVWLTECGADPYRRQRIEAEAAAQREARAEEERGRLAVMWREDNERKARAAQVIELALHARGELVASLVALGARERPPIPPARVEDPGQAPFPGARWDAGSWRWTGVEWTWDAGAWSDPTVFGETGGGGTVVVTSPPPSEAIISPAPTAVIVPVAVPVVTSGVHPAQPHTQGPAVRDHRGSAPPPKPATHDDPHDHRK